MSQSDENVIDFPRPDSVGLEADIAAVICFLHSVGIIYNAQRGTWAQRGTALKRTRVAGYVMTGCMRENGKRAFPPKIAEELVRIIQQRASEQFLIDLRYRLAYTGPSGAIARRMQDFLHADQFYPIRLLCVEQALWNIKRLLNGFTPGYRIMPILWSPEHGTGKSEYVEKLMEPFGLRAGAFDMNILVEKFSGGALSSNYVIHFEELRHAEIFAHEPGILKAAIDGRPNTNRDMYDDESSRAPNVATLFGTSNLPPGDCLPDPTGNRRIADLRVINTSIKLDTERAARLRKLSIIDDLTEVNERGPEPFEGNFESVIQYLKGVNQRAYKY